MPEALTGILLVTALAWLYYDSMLAVPFLLPLLIVWHQEWEKIRTEKAQEQFRQQFREWILLLSSSLTAGYSVENAFGQSLRELSLMFPEGGIMLEELKEMVRKAGNNQRPEQLLKNLAEKYPLEEVESFVEVFQIKRGKSEWNYPSDSGADGADYGYQTGDPDISGCKSI